MFSPMQSSSTFISPYEMPLAVCAVQTPTDRAKENETPAAGNNACDCDAAQSLFIKTILSFKNDFIVGLQCLIKELYLNAFQKRQRPNQPLQLKPMTNHLSPPRRQRQKRFLKKKLRSSQKLHNPKQNLFKLLRPLLLKLQPRTR